VTINVTQTLGVHISDLVFQSKQRTFLENEAKKDQGHFTVALLLTSGY